MRVGVNFLVAVLAAGCCSAGAAGAAGIEVIDDNGRAISLAQPARRVITLTPHVTEMIYAAGAGYVARGIARVATRCVSVVVAKLVKHRHRRGHGRRK